MTPFEEITLVDSPESLLYERKREEMGARLSAAAVANSSFGGPDIVAAFVFGDEVEIFGQLQTITYSIHRDPFLIRSLGSVNPLGYSVGHRTIAGSLVFTVFEKDVLARTLERVYSLDGQESSQAFNYVTHLPDELPPFNIFLHLNNEFGTASMWAIYGVKIVDDGGTFSINDLYTEQVLQYVAWDIVPLKPRSSVEVKNSNVPMDANGNWISTNAGNRYSVFPLQTIPNNATSDQLGNEGNTANIEITNSTRADRAYPVYR